MESRDEPWPSARRSNLQAGSCLREIALADFERRNEASSESWIGWCLSKGSQARALFVKTRYSFNKTGVIS